MYSDGPKQQLQIEQYWINFVYICILNNQTCCDFYISKQHCSRFLNILQFRIMCSQSPVQHFQWLKWSCWQKNTFSLVTKIFPHIAKNVWKFIPVFISCLPKNQIENTKRGNRIRSQTFVWCSKHMSLCLHTTLQNFITTVIQTMKTLKRRSKLLVYKWMIQQSVIQVFKMWHKKYLQIITNKIYHN